MADSCPYFGRMRIIVNSHSEKYISLLKLIHDVVLFDHVLLRSDRGDEAYLFQDLLRRFPVRNDFVI